MQLDSQNNRVIEIIYSWVDIKIKNEWVKLLCCIKMSIGHNWSLNKKMDLLYGTNIYELVLLYHVLNPKWKSNIISL